MPYTQLEGLHDIPVGAVSSGSISQILKSDHKLNPRFHPLDPCIPDSKPQGALVDITPQQLALPPGIACIPSARHSPPPGLRVEIRPALEGPAPPEEAGR